MKTNLTLAELKVVLWAIGNMTTANADDIDEMMSCGMTRPMARALKRAELKLMDGLPKKRMT